ncbi:movement protein [Sri Lankan cassava mosaic virus]|uniref:Movement protein BC1 n=1 Tax=Sri Lankan cassava mosaic virus TaxID=161378 RepID=A0A1N7TAR1_9GEMI|nr:BC1 [Sri Lankan cassava mosaic virus]AYH63717.1 movement protein [Sri Lankan cassava mosaic virus]QMT62512.1 movement protein [Sri Lankan cassava mosaic virus]QMT62520.1 movement protein [Sri Lankan cassava mosaic virus]UNA06177.1 movement protein [Sri Lankan cassava mosaic virus]
MENNSSNAAYLRSERVEYELTNDSTDVKLSFPSLLDNKISLLKGHCCKIDHIVLEYRNQVPINATGHVIIEIHDQRLHDGDSKQAEFTIPVQCNCNLHYYSSSFFSMKDINPWRVMYRVVDTNVINGVHFCRIQGKLKLSTAKQSNDIQFRSPKIEILSKAFTERDIDFWSVGRKPQQRKLVQGPSLIGSKSMRYTPCSIGPNESWAVRSEVGLHEPWAVKSEAGPSIEKPYSQLNRLNPDALDPGKSVSQIGSDNFTREDLNDIISKTVHMCLNTSMQSHVSKNV